MSEESKQPLFYNKPIPIQKELHSASGLDRNISYGFTKNTNSAPVNIQEFAILSKFYPIVFTADDLCSPVAVLGLKNEQNDFINHKGEWEKGFYIPAYIRRYPFAFSGAEDKLVLCIDESSERFRKKASSSDDMFFLNDEPSQLIKSALQFCSEYQRDQIDTLRFSKALKEKGILAERQINVVPHNKKEPVILAGFQIIDEERLSKLDDATVLEWHKNGYLALIYCQLISTSNWQSLTSKI